MRKQITLLLVVCFAVMNYVWAQNKTISGTVLDEQGNPVTASVAVKNTPTIGTTTSEAGTFSLSVPATADSLVVSALGYVKQTLAITGAAMQIRLQADVAHDLEEVVVVGYGTQRKGDLTAPVATVDLEQAAKRTVAAPMDALQGAVAGVQVVSSGAPGATPTVRIRGVGSFNNESPLYVVDGMFMDDISFLNPNDIADMSVLKDASGAAIYGVRAANGVVIVTTKKGSLNMKPRVTYNGYVGMQTPSNVLKMANGQQYAAYVTAKGEGHIAESSADRFGGTAERPAMNTDWYGELLRSSAMMTNHNLDVQGGGENITYAFGINYVDQDGIMDAENYVRRYNIRMQTEARVAPWLKLGFTAHLNNFNTFSPNNVAFRQAYFASPLYPAYDDGQELATPVQFGSSQTLGLEGGFWYGNPIATAYYNNNQSKGFQVLPNAYVEAEFWEHKLTFRSQFSQRYQSTHGLQYSPVYYLDNAQRNDRSYLRSAQGRNLNYILDNLLTYRDEAGKHHWSVLLGQSTRQERWRETWVSANDVPEDPEFWYVGQGAQGIGSATGYGEGGFRNAGVSFFTRGTYDFDNKYLLTATFRADGSSKYQTKWGYFPSLGLGWVISREGFMQDQQLLDNLKIRGSWGRLGNDGIQPNAGYAIVNSGNNSSGIFGSIGSTYGSRIPGYTVNRFFTNVSWEVVEEWDGGVDFAMFGNRLNGTVDYYYRVTHELAFERPLPFVWDRVYGNWGSVANSGWEIGLDWNDRVGDFGYSVGVNATTLKNRVLDLGGLANIQNGFPEWTAEFPARIEEGQPINYYYGYQAVGVYQNEAEINADPIASQYNLNNPDSPILPGYLRYKDQNGNDELDEEDRINLGNYLPELTYGATIGLSYKGFDFNLMVQGVAGNKIHNLNRAMRRKYAQMNIDAAFVEGLWTGEGSTNAYPSAQGSVAAWNLQASSFFVESGAYLRVQNIQLGYSFDIRNSIPVRVFATADRPFIFTKYNGFTPEVTGMGYDANVYPVSSTYSLGLRVTF